MYFRLYFSTSNRMVEENLPFLNWKRHKNAIKNAGIKMQVLEAALGLPSYIMN